MITREEFDEVMDAGLILVVRSQGGTLFTYRKIGEGYFMKNADPLEPWLRTDNANSHFEKFIQHDILVSTYSGVEYMLAFGDSL